MIFSFLSLATSFLSGVLKSSSEIKFNLTRSSKRTSIGIEQQVALQDLQLFLVYFNQESGFSLSTSSGFSAADFVSGIFAIDYGS